MPRDETGPDGVACPEIGPGWRRISKKRTTDPTQRHTDHVFLSPDGQRFNSQIKAMRHRDGGEPADGGGGAAGGAGGGGKAAQKAKDTWVQCERCDKWRKLPSSGAKLPKHWYCELNPDDAYASCASSTKHVPRSRRTKGVIGAATVPAVRSPSVRAAPVARRAARALVNRSARRPRPAAP